MEREQVHSKALNNATSNVWFILRLVSLKNTAQSKQYKASEQIYNESREWEDKCIHSTQNIVGGSSGKGRESDQRVSERKRLLQR